jgi:hypothetical protein
MLRPPSKATLPDGPHREFVEKLFGLYRAAGRPPLRAISGWITENWEATDLRGSASTETIRRVLTGSTVPRHWWTVECIVVALCILAGRNPDEEDWDDVEGQMPSARDEAKHLWNVMLTYYESNEEMPVVPPRREPQLVVTNWGVPPAAGRTPATSAPARAASNSFGDEPPF